MSWDVPLTSLVITEEDVEAVLDCMRSGWLTMGPRTQDFETAFGEWMGSTNALSVSSGTAALHLALAGLGVGPGDEVIVPNLTFVATAACARFVGATPVVADILAPQVPLLDPEDVARRITPRTKAVVAVHLFGYPADVAALRRLCDEHGLALVEDCAQGIGARLDDQGTLAGRVGDVGTFSLFSKNQLAVGEGGLLVTERDDVAERVRTLRSHAMTTGTWDRHRGHALTYDVVDVGFNFRLDEPRAALGLARLSRLDDDIQARRGLARRYRAAFADLNGGIELMFDDAAGEQSSHFAFTVLLPDRERRDAFRESLREQGVQTTWYPALTDLTEYSAFGPAPIGVQAAHRHCAIPMSASLDGAAEERVMDAVRNAAHAA
ncbi:MAG TPA: DegT/DnrJ/EryC1/StrS aminotransferase family protein [Gaiellaceae bacterium]|nr:DegT/DnrJ/EryC1/StrS aminotransferase family protein [Gaiellaceae bacterium]